MDGTLAVNDINELSLRLGQAIKLMGKYGREQAEAEKAYKVALRQVCLRLRDEGMPVGMIDKVCYGDPGVADARLKRDIADAMYKTSQEHINSIKLQIRILNDQISREWGSNG